MYSVVTVVVTTVVEVIVALLILVLAVVVVVVVVVVLSGVTFVWGEGGDLKDWFSPITFIVYNQNSSGGGAMGGGGVHDVNVGHAPLPLK